MNERRIKVLTVFAVCCGLLINFQNCGSQNNSSSGTAQAVTSDDGHMDIIDENTTGSIQFAESKVQVSSQDTELKTSGICSSEQDGGLLGWKVLDIDGQVIAQGKALCDHGVFDVVIAGADSLACNTELKLKAFFGSKAKAELPISKVCN